MNKEKAAVALRTASVALLLVCAVLLGLCVKGIYFSDSSALDLDSLVSSVAQLHAEFSSTAATSNATAFVVDDSGAMLTNFHALASENSDGSYELASDLTVRFSDEEDYSSATIVKYDETLDIAVIRSERASVKSALPLAEEGSLMANIGFGGDSYQNHVVATYVSRQFIWGYVIAI